MLDPDGQTETGSAAKPRARFVVLGGKGQGGTADQAQKTALQGSTAAASIAGASSACYLQTIPAQPGDRLRQMGSGLHTSLFRLRGPWGAVR